MAAATSCKRRSAGREDEKTRQKGERRCCSFRRTDFQSVRLGDGRIENPSYEKSKRTPSGCLEAEGEADVQTVEEADEDSVVARVESTVVEVDGVPRGNGVEKGLDVVADLHLDALVGIPPEVEGT